MDNENTFNNELQREISQDADALKKKKKRSKAPLVGVICAVIGILAGAYGMWVYNYYDSYRRAKGLHDKVAVVQYVLDKEYLYEYDEEELGDYAALGMTLGLAEPYTTYYPKEEFSAFMDDGNGDFVGVGIVVIVNSKENTIEIESVVNGGPAEKAGVLPGDIIKAVDGESFTAMEFSQAVSKVRGTDIEGGSAGHKLTLTVIRDGKDMDFEIVREKIHTDSVESEIIENDIGYLKITGFNTSDGEHPDTFEEFKTHFERLTENGAKKLIIDVRDNGGGNLDTVASIIDMIVPEGAIMYAEDKKGKRDYLYSDKDEVSMPMVVLVNGNSASASELLTGALKDYEKATVVGTKTYGKGVMQAVFPFTDGSGMVVTIAKYYTPKGNCVHGEGITPDVEIELTSDKTLANLTYEEDNQLQKAVEIIKAK